MGYNGIIYPDGVYCKRNIKKCDKSCRLSYDFIRDIERKEKI